ncbi:hypothetical protein CRYUN_Cryun12cG0095000 [Craigia yunnanensis]
MASLRKSQDHIALLDSVISPVTDSIIANITKQYIDTRAQANLSKLNANPRQELDIITENKSHIIERRQNPEIFETAAAPRISSSIWGSPRLEEIALRWTPITFIAVVASVLLWISLILTDDFLISTL